MPACASSGVYAPRDTHRCDAAVLVRHHVARFLERVEAGSHGPLPDFVQAELRGFAVCGDFSQGFVRTACRRCGDELRVPFPCKGRGFCPSCMGRRMAEGAALLVDHVLPAVGYRQWVLSFTGPMAVRLGYDRELLAAVSGRLARAVLQDIRRAVKREHGLASVASLHGGVVTVVQRFRCDLGLYVHLHLLVTDGAFEERGDELPFRPAPPPTPERMTAILGRVREVLAAAGQDADDDLDLDPALAACVQHSLRGPHFAAGAPDTEPPPHTVSAYGLQLHAATTVDGRDRRRLERVCRYLLRPPFAHDAIEALADGRVRVHLKSPSRRGVAFADMSVDTFLSRLTRPGAAAAFPHDPLLWGLRQPPPPPRAGHPVLAAAGRADPALPALHARSPGRAPRGDLDPPPVRLGEPARPGLRRRRDGLLEVRRQDADPRGRHRSRGHRRAPLRRPRAAATLSSWAVGVVRLSARGGIAVGFARPAADRRS